MLHAVDSEIGYFNKRTQKVYEAIGPGYLRDLIPEINPSTAKNTADRMLDGDTPDNLNSPDLVKIPKLETRIYFKFFVKTFTDYPIVIKQIEIDDIDEQIKHMDIPTYRTLINKISTWHQTFDQNIISRETLSELLETVYVSYIKEWLIEISSKNTYQPKKYFQRLMKYFFRRKLNIY